MTKIEAAIDRLKSTLKTTVHEIALLRAKEDLLRNEIMALEKIEDDKHLE